MAKNTRPPLEMADLTENLKTSKGQGANAFFPSSPTVSPIKPPPSVDEPKNQSLVEESHGKSNVSVNTTNNIETKKESKKEINTKSSIASNITILQITEKDIEELREPAEKVQSFRLPTWATEYLRDATYELSKESKRGKIGQGDILSIGILLFDKFRTSNKEEMKEILDKIK